MLFRSLKQLKLAGDWLLIGNVLQHGNVMFSTHTLNNFRRHEQTARARVNSPSAHAEYILTKYQLFRNADRPLHEYARFLDPAQESLGSDTIQLDATLKRLLEISKIDTIRWIITLAISMPINQRYFKVFFNPTYFKQFLRQLVPTRLRLRSRGVDLSVSPEKPKAGNSNAC